MESERNRLLTEEASLGQAVDHFRATLQDDAKAEFDRLRENAAREVIDVAEFIDEIDEKGRKTHSTWKPYGNHVQGMLFNIQRLSFLTCFDGPDYNQEHLTSSVWASVCMCLLLSLYDLPLFQGWTSYLMLGGLLASIPDDLCRLSPRDYLLQTTAIEYLRVIVTLCNSFAQAQGSLLLTRWFTDHTNTNKLYQESQEKLILKAKQINERLQYLYSKDALGIKGIFFPRKVNLKERNSQRIFNFNKERCYELYKHLSPDQDVFDSVWMRQHIKGTVNWILEEHGFLAWASKTPEDSVVPYRNILLLTGGWGTGKTVATANIVSYLLQKKNHVVIPVFCEKSHEMTLNPKILLASIAQRIVKAAIHTITSASEITIIHPVYRQSEFAKDTHSLSGLVLQAFKDSPLDAVESYDILIDGIHELERSDAQYLLNSVRTWQRLDLSRRVHICITQHPSSELMPIISKLWGLKDSSKNELKISGPRHEAELKQYISSELGSRLGFQTLSRSTQDLLINTLARLANGVYLWANLGMDQLFPKYTYQIPSEADFIGLLLDCANKPTMNEFIEEEELKRDVQRMYIDPSLKDSGYGSAQTRMPAQSGTAGWSDSDPMGDVKQKSLAVFPPLTISRSAPEKSITAIFEIDWNPVNFLKEQKYEGSPSEALSHAITLTGAPNDAQALTTREYLSQVWPTTSSQILKLVAEVIQNEVGAIATCK